MYFLQGKGVSTQQSIFILQEYEKLSQSDGKICVIDNLSTIDGNGKMSVKT